MDTNSRQNQSTHTPANASAKTQNRASAATATAKAAMGKHARQPQAQPGALDQNTAFGTSKNPEGFVKTWKEATHLWRWRAVLCVFLALLLMMMQPSGNALYRSWNAASGEMMGLAAAVNGEEIDTLDDDNIQDVSGANTEGTGAQGTANGGGSGDGAGTVAGTTGNEKSEDGTGTSGDALVTTTSSNALTTDLVTGSIPLQTAGENDPTETEQEEGIHDTARVFFFADYNDAPERKWAPGTQTSTSTAKNGHTYNEFTVVYDPANPGDANMIKAYPNNVSGVGVTLPETANASNGYLGAVSWVGQSGETIDDSTALQVLELNDITDTYVGAWAWAYGYRLKGWEYVNPTNLWNTQPGGLPGQANGFYNSEGAEDLDHTVYLFTANSIIKLFNNKLTSDDNEYYSNTTASTAPVTFGSIAADSTVVGKTNQYYDTYVFATWEKREGDPTSTPTPSNPGYVVYVGPTLDWAAPEDSETGAWIDGGAWDRQTDGSTSASYSSMTESLKYAVLNGSRGSKQATKTRLQNALSNDDVVWALCPVKDGRMVNDPVIMDVDIESTRLGSILAPSGGGSDATLDPYNKRSKYATKGTLGSVAIVPGFTVTYNANGGGDDKTVWYPLDDVANWYAPTAVSTATITSDTKVLDNSSNGANMTFGGRKLVGWAKDSTPGDASKYASILDGALPTLVSAWTKIGGTSTEVESWGTEEDPDSEEGDYYTSLYKDIILYAQWSPEISFATVGGTIDETPSNTNPYDITAVPTYTANTDAGYTENTGVWYKLTTAKGGSFADLSSATSASGVTTAGGTKVGANGTAAEVLADAQSSTVKDGTNDVMYVCVFTQGSEPVTPKGSLTWVKGVDSDDQAAIKFSGLIPEEANTGTTLGTLTTAAGSLQWTDGATDEQKLKYDLSDVTWDYGTGNSSDTELTTGGATLTATPKRLYTVTVTAAEGELDDGVPSLTVYKVPEGTPYGAIKYVKGETGEETGKNIFSTDDKATSLSDTVANGWGTRGWYPNNTSGKTEDPWSGVWSGGNITDTVETLGATDSDPKVTGATSLTYTYDKGYNKVAYKLASTPSNAHNGQTTTDITTAGASLTKTEEYVAFDDWTANGLRNLEKPTLALGNNDTLKAAYANEEGSATLAWSDDPANDDAIADVDEKGFTYTATPALKTYTVTVKVADATDTNTAAGKLTKDAAGANVTTPASTLELGSVSYGDKPAQVFTAGSEYTTFAGYVAAAVTADNTWVTTDATWDSDPDANDATVTANATYTYKLQHDTYSLTLKTNASGTPAEVRTITGIPYGTNISTIQYDQGNKWVKDGGTLLISQTNIPLTGSNGYACTASDITSFASGLSSTTIENASPSNSTSKTIEFTNYALKNVTVKYVMADNTGTWQDGNLPSGATLSDDKKTITLSVPYNTTLATSQVPSIDGSASFTPAAGYKAGNVTDAAWDTNPVGQTVTADETTFTLTPASYSYTVTYEIASTAQAAVAFGGTFDEADVSGNTTVTVSKSGLSAGDTTPAAPTELQAYDGNSDYVKKYTGGSTVTPEKAATVTGTDESITYTVTPTEKTYTITYEIDGGSWKLGDSENATEQKKFGETLNSKWATCAVTGTSSSDVVNAGGNVVDGNWKGKWQVKVEGSNNYTDLADISGLSAASTPRDYVLGTGITATDQDEYTFKLVLTPVVNITFAYSGVNDKTSTTTAMYVGDALTAPTDMEAADGYKKSTDYGFASNELTSGSWDATVPSTVPNSAITYTYTFEPVTTITYHIVGGKWASEIWQYGDAPKDTQRDLVTQVFSGSADASTNDNLIIPVGERLNSNYNATGTWHKGSADGDTITTPTKTDATDYYLVFAPQAMSYNIEVYEETIASAKAHATDGVADDARAYDKVDAKTITRSSNLYAGAKYGLMSGDVTQIEDNNAMEGFTRSTTYGDQPMTEDQINADANANILGADGDDGTLKVYYKRDMHTISYTYTYSEADKAVIDEASTRGLNTLPAYDETVYVPYGDTYTIQSITAPNGYEWGKWTWTTAPDGATAGEEANDGTMGTKNLAVSGAWTRASATITLTTDKDKGTITFGGETNDSSGQIVDSTHKYGDAMPAATHTDGTGYKFSGWSGTGLSGDANENLPSYITATTMDFTANWNNRIRFIYQPDSANIGTFAKQGEETWIDPNNQVTHFDLGTDNVNDPRKAHKNGYTFSGWTWKLSTDENAHTSGIEDQDVTNPFGNATASESITFTATYTANEHVVKLDLDGGTYVNDLTHANLIPSANLNSGDYKQGTGTQVYLPNPSEVEKANYVLTGYKIEQPGETTITVDKNTANFTTSGYTYTVAAGAANDYNSAVTITAQYEGVQNTLTVTTSVENGGTDSIVSDLAAKAAVLSGAKTFGTEVDLSSVATGDYTGYHFVGFDPDTYITSNKLTMPATSHTVVAKWAKNSYNVKFELASGYDDVELDGTTTGAVLYGNKYAVATPKLKGKDDAALDTEKYTENGIVWKLQGAETALSDITFGETGGITWTTGATYTFIGTPTLVKHSIVVAVEGGTMTDPTLTEDNTGKTSATFSDQDWGTLFTNITNFPNTIDGFSFTPTPDSDYWNGAGTWSSNKVQGEGDANNPFTDGQKVETDETFTYTLPKKAYTVNFVLTDNKGETVTLSYDGDKTASGTTVYSGDAFTIAGNFPTLKESGSLTAEEFAKTYETQLSWTLNDGTTAVGANGTYGDSMQNAEQGTTDYATAHTITLKGTPVLKDYTVTVATPEGGTYSGDTRITTAHYGQTLSELIDATKLAPDANHMPSGHWVNSAGDTVQLTDTLTAGDTFTYKFDTKRTVTFKVEGGTFADGTSEKTYWVGDDTSYTSTDDRAKRNNGFSAGVLSTNGTTAFADSAIALGSPSTGYANTGTWTVNSSDKSYLTGEEGNKTPDKTYAVTENVTYTYTFDTKQVTYTFYKHYQGVDPSETDDYTKSADAKKLTWTGSYSSTPVTINETNLPGLTAEANSGFSGTPTVTAEQTEGTSGTMPTGATVTSFTPHSEDGGTYHLWYNLVQVNYEYNVAKTFSGNAEPATTTGSADNGNVRWGKSINLATIADSSNALTFSGWYTEARNNTDGTFDNEKLAAGLGQSYTFQPNHTTSQAAVTVTLYGAWNTAYYPVTFAVQPQAENLVYNTTDNDETYIDEKNRYDMTDENWFVNDYSADADRGAKVAITGKDAAKSVATEGIEYGTTVGDQSPTVTPSDSAKYADVTTWKLYVNGTQKTGDDLKALLPNDSTHEGDTLTTAEIADIKVLSSGYVFYPVFTLKQYTVNLSGGTIGTIGQVEGYTKFTDYYYGEKVDLPNVSNGTDVANQGLINGLEQVKENGNPIIDSEGRAPVDSANEPAYYANTLVDKPAAWKLSKAPNTQWPNEGKLSVTGTATYEYQYSGKLYNVVFKNAAAKTGDSTYDTTSQTYALNDLWVKDLKWTDNVFANGALYGNGGSTKLGTSTNITAVGYDPADVDNATNPLGAKVYNPTSDSFVFGGWRQGNASAAGGTTFATTKTSITVSELYNSALNSGTQPYYIWGTWTGKGQTITFYPNHTDNGVTDADKQTQNATIGTPVNLKSLTQLGSKFSRTGYHFGGWATTSNGEKAYDDEQSYTASSTTDLDLFAIWEPNTYTVKWKTFDPTKYVTWQDMSVTPPEGAAATDPYVVTKTYAETEGNLPAVYATAGETAVKAGTTNTWIGWNYGTEVLSDTIAVTKVRTATDGAEIVLTPKAAANVTLTYDTNADDDTSVTFTSGLTDDTDTAGMNLGTGDAANKWARFTIIDAEPARHGYTFNGWNIAEAKTAVSGATASGTVNSGAEVFVDGSSKSSFIAEAQWTEKIDNTYEVNRYVYNKTTKEYDKVQTITKTDGTTGATVKLGEGSLSDVSADYEGYTLVSGLSNTEVEVTPTDYQDAVPAAINLYYDAASFTVSYVYTDKDGKALTGDAASATPMSPSSFTVEGGAQHTVQTVPTTLPEGYKLATGYSTWQYVKPLDTNPLWTIPGTGEVSTAVATGPLTAGTDYIVKNNATLQLRLEQKTYSVTFKLGENGSSIGATNISGTGGYTKADIVHGTMLSLSDLGVSVKAADGYAPAGWLYQNNDDNEDPLNGTTVSPDGFEVNANVTFTAQFAKTHSVTWLPGANSVNQFKSTPNDQKKFENLDGTYTWQAGSGTSNTTKAGVNLDAADGTDNVPIAADGYSFTGWKVKVLTPTDSPYYTDAVAAVNGQTYTTLSALYAAVPPSADYEIEAQWEPLVQTVVFDPSIGSGAASTATTVTLTGASGSAYTNDETPVEAAAPTEEPPAADGWTFVEWRTNDGQKLDPGQKFSFPKKASPATTTYYAVWQAQSVNIEFNRTPAGGGSVTANPSLTGITANTDATLTIKAAANAGYKFVRWESTNLKTDVSDWYNGAITTKSDSKYGLITLQKDATTNLYKADTYTAFFEKESYDVTFVDPVNAKGHIDNNYNQSVLYNGKVDQSITYAGTPNAGYEFKGWKYTMQTEDDKNNYTLKTLYTNKASNDPRTVQIKGPTVFTAVYEPMQVTLSYDGNGGEGTVGSTTGTAGGAVKLSEPSYVWAGHTPLGWMRADANGDAPASTMTFAAFNEAKTAGTAWAAGDDYTLGGSETLYAVYAAEAATLVYDNNAADFTGTGTVSVTAKHASYSAPINQGEDSTVLSMSELAAIEGSEYKTHGVSATQPGYKRTDDAVGTEVPGSMRNFLGWSFDKNAANNPDSVIYEPGETIAKEELPPAKYDTGTATKRTLYAIYADKTFKVSINGAGGVSDTPVQTLLADDVVYGGSVNVPANPYTREGFAFLYWLANDNDNPSLGTRVSNSTGAAATYTFIGSKDVTLTAQWQSMSDVPDRVRVQFYDETDTQLTQNPVGPYTEYDAPMTANSGFEALTVVGNEGGRPVTKDTSDYKRFDGWYLGTTRVADQAVNKEWTVTQLVQNKYNGSVTSLGSALPLYWANDDFTEAFTGTNAAAKEPLKLYAKKTLLKYDVVFDPNVPTDSGYTDEDVDELDSITVSTTKAENVKDPDNTHITLSDKTYELAGYRFLGWAKNDTNGATTTSALYNDDDNASNRVAKDHDFATADSLMSADSKTAETSITLYAMWEPIATNKVTFYDTYADDGVRTEGDDHVYAGAEANNPQNDLLLTSVIAAPSSADPETYEGQADIAFDGWYTEKYGVGVTPDADKKVTPGVTTIKAIAESAGLTPEEDGSYDIKLYAAWSRDGVRVVYHDDGSDDGPESGVQNPTALPGTQTQRLTEQQDGSFTGEITLAANPLSKAGYHANGWVGKGNTATYASDASWYNKAFAAACNLPFDTKGARVDLYAAFAENTYKVTYNLKLPTDYKSYVMTEAVAGKKGSADVKGVEGLTWTGATKVYDSATTYDADKLPQLEGYTFAGFTITTPGNNKLTVQDGWTVKNLYDAMVAKDGGVSANPTEYAKIRNDATYEFTFDAAWTPNTYTIAYVSDGGTLISTSAAPANKTGIAWTASADGLGNRLYIPANQMEKVHNSGLVWYLDSAKTAYPANKQAAGANTDTPTVQDLVYYWHQAQGHTASSPAIADGATITLYAKWVEDTTPVSFSVSDSAHARITDTTASTFDQSLPATLSYTVGVESGAIEGGGNITDKTAKVLLADGYEIAGWTFNDETYGAAGTAATLTLTDAAKVEDGNGATHKVWPAGDYKATIQGKTSTVVKVELWDQGADGEYAKTDTVETTAGAFTGTNGAQARTGSTIAVEELAKARTSTPDYLELVPNRTNDLVVAGTDANANANTVQLYYKRATADVSFELAWEGTAPSTLPALPDDVKYQSVVYEGSVDVPAALPDVPGYKFDAWYKGSVADANKLTSGGTTTMDDAGGITLIANYKKGLYTVKFSGVYADNGTTDLNGVDSLALTAGASTTFEDAIPAGSQMKDYVKVTVTDQATTDTQAPIIMGKADADADHTVAVEYNSAKRFIVWQYTMNGTTKTTANPTTVEINGSVEFKAIGSATQVIAYLPGEHGTFASTTDAGTRKVGVTPGYSMSSYYFDVIAPDELETALPANNANSGLPKGEDGWKFAGWEWSYVSATGETKTGKTSDFTNVDTATAQQLMRAGMDSLTDMPHGITLTALWTEAPSNLAFDLNFGDKVTAGADQVDVRASWAEGYVPEAGEHLTDEVVDLPDADKVVRNGFTLKKWIWESSDGTFEYNPGATFTMPAQLRSDTVTLKAKWEEDYATFTYVADGRSMGDVADAETVGVWSGHPRGSATGAPAGSGITVKTGYEFQEWQVNSPTQTGVYTNANNPTWVDASNNIVPQRNADKRYETGTYTAKMRGIPQLVEFLVDPNDTQSDGTPMGSIVDQNGTPLTNADRTKYVPYGSSYDMSGVRAKAASRNYELVAGEYWDYYMLPYGTTTWPDDWQTTLTKSGTTSDPSTITITGYAKFVANFQESSGAYEVRFDPRYGDSVFDPVYKAWSDSNIGYDKTPHRTGYTFSGWWANEAHAGLVATVANKAKYEEEPGNKAAATSTYGQMAGGEQWAEYAAEHGITLYAGWTENVGYKVTFNANEGTVAKVGEASADAAATKTVSDLAWTGALTGKVQKPVRAGHTFLGWYTLPSGGTQVIAADGTGGELATYEKLAEELAMNDPVDATDGQSLPLYAQWSEDEYTLEFVNEDGSDFEDGVTVIKKEKVKYSDLVTIGVPTNSKVDEREWAPDNAVDPSQWTVSKGTAKTVVTSATKMSDLIGWEIDPKSAEEPTTYVVTAHWTNYVPYTTTYALYQWYDSSIDPEDGQYLEDRYFSRLEKLDEYMSHSETALPGEIVGPNIDDIATPPGFTYSPYLTLNVENLDSTGAPLYGSLDDMERGAAAGLEFTIAVVAKLNYKVAYDLNDSVEHPGGTQLADTGVAGGGHGYTQQAGKTFYDKNNLPWYGSEATPVLLPDPVRAGFEFDGWYNLAVDETAEVAPENAIKATEDLRFGDLTFDEGGTWYDPWRGDNGVLTLHARWSEIPHTVHYIVAEDMKDRVEIRLNNDSDEYSTDERTEVIGAATGDLFVNGARVAGQSAQGAVAQAKRGYTFGGWKIVVDDAEAQSGTYEMKLDVPSLVTAAVNDALVATLQTAAVIEAANAGVYAQATRPVEGIALMTAAADDDTATSAQGKMYSTSASITPGVRTDDGDGLFAGEAPDGVEDDSSHVVLYVATASENAPATTTIDPGEGTYNGDLTFTQPWGTYLGEKQPWGTGEGSLPTGEITRPGYKFDGWIIPAGTEYYDKDGVKHVFEADTPLKPGDENSTRIVLPQNGLKLTAAWSKLSADDEKPTHTVTIPETTLEDGTVIPGETFEVPEGSKLTDEQIEKIINRGGKTVDKWDVTYYDPTTKAWVVKEGDSALTTDELRELLKTLEIDGDVTIKPSKNAKASDYVAPTTKDDRTRPAKDRAAKTGDLMPILPIAGTAVVAALVLAFLFLLRRRHE